MYFKALKVYFIQPCISNTSCSSHSFFLQNLSDCDMLIGLPALKNKENIVDFLHFPYFNYCFNTVGNLHNAIN